MPYRWVLDFNYNRENHRPSHSFGVEKLPDFVTYFILIVVFYLIPRESDMCCFKHQSISARQRSIMNFWRVFLYLLFVIYPSLSSTVLRHYVCKEIDGISFMWADLRQRCFTDMWTTVSYANIPLVLLYPIGIPLFFLALLLKNKKSLQVKRIKAQLGFLYAGYRAEAWWFEMADCGHKLFLTSILAFFDRDYQIPIGCYFQIIFHSFRLPSFFASIFRFDHHHDVHAPLVVYFSLLACR